MTRRAPQRQQRACQSAGAGANLYDGGVFERAGRARDPGSKVEVEQEVLAERFARRQSMITNDLAQRRQVIDRRHVVWDAMRAASRNAAIRLDGLARPVPAISNAVP